jgi:diaminohydroxyphosphoribosylaminopyrimidine deaminase/5-amino-6-(5-phosphoribosylamino)uracil reductase
MDLDHRLMRRALRLARRAAGSTAPNPAVGCVIAHGDRIVAEAATAPGGRPHAEALALAAAGAAARGATAYVTLEPCAHHGLTPPCADALAAAGIARVVVAVGQDPDPRVNGSGIARLRAAGVAVTVGVLECQAEEVIQGFRSRVERGRPWVTLKLALSLDGRIAPPTGSARWLTGPAARRRVHALRAMHDAVLVGIGTVLADDPELTCRLAGCKGRPRWRVVADARLRTPAAARLLRDARHRPVVLLAAEGAEAGSLADVPGVTVVRVPAAADGGVEPGAALRGLARLGVGSVLAEGGGRLAASLLRGGLVDRLELHRAPLVLGADAVPALGALGLDGLGAAPRLVPVRRFALGPDLIEILEPLPPGYPAGARA